MKKVILALSVIFILGILSRVSVHAEPVRVVPTPTVTAAPTVTPTVAPREIPQTQHIIYLVNQERVRFGLAPVSELAVLNQSSYLKAQDLTHSAFSHNDSKGRWFTGFITDAGWTGTAGENLAKGYNTDEEAVAAWMASPTHRANILQVNAIYAGYSQVGTFRVMHFGGYH